MLPGHRRTPRRREGGDRRALAGLADRRRGDPRAPRPGGGRRAPRARSLLRHPARRSQSPLGRASCGRCSQVASTAARRCWSRSVRSIWSGSDSLVEQLRAAGFRVEAIPQMRNGAQPLAEGRPAAPRGEPMSESKPHIHPSVFVAPTAQLFGAVEIGAELLGLAERRGPRRGASRHGRPLHESPGLRDDPHRLRTTRRRSAISARSPTTRPSTAVGSRTIA